MPNKILKSKSTKSLTFKQKNMGKSKSYFKLSHNRTSSSGWCNWYWSKEQKKKKKRLRFFCMKMVTQIHTQGDSYTYVFELKL